MSQQPTKETAKPLPKDSNKARPFDKVSIIWAGSQFVAPGHISEEHPVFAAKMVEAGKASYNDGTEPAAGKKASKKTEEK